MASVDRLRDGPDALLERRHHDQPKARGHIVRDQKPLALTEHDTLQQACRQMFERGTGSVLVIDDDSSFRHDYL
jgi:signal-transduction protein with cAMP-binding, CBS, and nucleotidyltransferase domain